VIIFFYLFVYFEKCWVNK